MLKYAINYYIMEIDIFINNFAKQFDETDASEFNETTKFHELEEWSSIIGLAVLNMITKRYNVRVTPAEMKEAVTIKDLFNVVQLKH